MLMKNKLKQDIHNEKITNYRNGFAGFGGL